MRRKEKKKIFDINNINKKTLNIIGVILSIIIIIIVTVYYSLNMNREYINGDKKLPFLIEKTKYFKHFFQFFSIFNWLYIIKFIFERNYIFIFFST